MKPYMLIEGSNLSIESFEQKITAALEMGYSFAGDLISHPVSSNELKFYQPVILIEDEEEYEDEDEMDDESDDQVE
jgi:hypothetical protein